MYSGFFFIKISNRKDNLEDRTTLTHCCVGVIVNRLTLIEALKENFRTFSKKKIKYEK